MITFEKVQDAIKDTDKLKALLNEYSFIDIYNKLHVYEIYTSFVAKTLEKGLIVELLKTPNQFLRFLELNSIQTNQITISKIAETQDISLIPFLPLSARIV